MNIVIFQHIEFDDVAVFSEWASREGHTLQVCVPAEGIDPSLLEGADLLIILGSPLSVYQEDPPRWLSEEKAFVKQGIDQGIRVLGICFGAQMLAELLGGSVFPNEEKEIGWHPICRTDEHHPWLEGLPAQFYSMQWHGDTFTLPEGAIPLAYSAACKTQAFSYGEHIVGLQFHLEHPAEVIEQMITAWHPGETKAPFIQTAEHIRAQYGRCQTSLQMLQTILTNIQKQGSQKLKSTVIT
ncbi:type 1 glutamine amidotransferase [Marinicrinis lubricantis]